jgi:hypothetical protein
MAARLREGLLASLLVLTACTSEADEACDDAAKLYASVLECTADDAIQSDGICEATQAQIVTRLKASHVWGAAEPEAVKQRAAEYLEYCGKANEAAAACDG